jgi:hypothetical protein
MALWWVRAGDLPTPIEARHRLEHLIANGPSPHAFTFKERFAPPAKLSSTMSS